MCLTGKTKLSDPMLLTLIKPADKQCCFRQYYGLRINYHARLIPYDTHPALTHLITNPEENRYPVTADSLASQLQISVRSVYRDIETLRCQGAEITGEAGLGYQMKSGLLLPPMIFDVNELEALILGLRWVQSNADDGLKASAARAANKINAVVEHESRAVFSDSTLFVPASQLTQVDNIIAGNCAAVCGKS